MKFSIGMSLRSTLLAGLALGLLAGCEQAKRSSHLHFFPEQTKVNSSIDAQADNGARSDPTLNAIHFDGSTLNSLGQTKINRLATGPADKTVVVYLDIPADENTKARHDSIAACMEHCGREAGKFKVVDGYNPGTSTMAGGSLSRMSKTETGGADAAGTGAGVGAPAAQSAAK